jgi:hypothetical protein
MSEQGGAAGVLLLFTLLVLSQLSSCADRRQHELDLAAVAAVDGASAELVSGAWIYRGRDGRAGVGRTVPEAVDDWRGGENAAENAAESTAENTTEEPAP